jgi:FkbM family methyltransferase
MSMVTLKGLANTVVTTRNFWDAWLLRISGGKKNIVFRNGIKVGLNWEEYCRIRDWFGHLRSEAFTFQRVGGAYCVEREDLRFRFLAASLEAARALFELIFHLISRGWTVEQLDDRLFSIMKGKLNCTVHQLNDGLYSIESNRVKMVGPLDALVVYLCECESGTYDCDYSNKVVLDVGGFCGETAVFFSSQGAKKVIVYEPVVTHHDFIKRNMMLNGVEAELHEEGIGERDGVETIRYESADLGFGILSKGSNELTVKVKNAARVIEESKADIGKFDCEGAETCLLSLSKATLRRIDFYIIETHTSKIRKAIIDKFSDAGFKFVQALKDDLSVLHFEKVPQLSDITEPAIILPPYEVEGKH